MEECFGIIGGLGPKSTVHFMNDIVDRTVAKRDQDHPEYILLNHPTIPDRTAYILDRSNPSPLPYLYRDVQKLVDLNVNFIVMPCNTAHYFFEELQSHSPVPLVNMIRETAAYITKYFPGDKRIGILGTPGTLRSNLYQGELLKEGLIPVIPTEDILAKVSRLIFQQAKQGKCIDHHAYARVLQSMYDRGCDRIILGCTELSLIEDETREHDFPIIDAQAVLAEKTILWAGKQITRLHAYEKRGLAKAGEGH